MRAYERSWWWVKEKKPMALVLFITITMMLQFQMKGCVGCVETERMGLLQLKTYLKSLLSLEEEDQKENILKSWSHGDRNSDCCHWERVNCSDAIGGHIINLTLYNILPYNFESPPRSLNLSLLHSFPQLKNLDFSFNQFNDLFDPIHGHNSFQRLNKLRTLDLSGNRLNITVLRFLSAARSLRTLNFGFNKQEGVFPTNGNHECSLWCGILNMPMLRVLNLEENGFRFFSVQDLTNLRKLEVLSLSGNYINDFKAGDGLKTTKLKTLDLSYNNFSHTARLKGLEYLVELKDLRLITNRFNDTQSIQVLKDMPSLQELHLTGSEFTSLESLGVVFPSSLQVLNLRSNQLSLNLKGYSEICRLRYLRELDLSRNALTNLPNCLGNLTRLRTLYLSDNQLNGNLFSFVSSLPSALEYLSLLRINFNGSFSFNSLVNQTRLKVLRLSSKVGMIQAKAESSWIPLFQLKMLTLHNFTTIPGFLVHQHDLRLIDLSYSQLAGAFPTWLVVNNTRLEAIILISNSLTELQLPRLVHGLQVLDISSNSINDSIQEDIGIIFPKLRYMKFSSNHFHGTFPSSMSEMKRLQVLDVSSNRLSGQLSKTLLSALYSLKVLKLSNNQFQGKIFPEHANLTSLIWLALDGNNFGGSLGKGLLNSKPLSFLDISDNNFSGALPLWFGRMSSLSRLYMRGNQLKGPFPSQLQNLELAVIDMSHNSFYGSIPWNYNFSSLISLRLQNNELIGLLPDNLFKAEDMEVLDLRNNNFSGMILNTSIGKTSHLGVLLLRNNSFQGHIPEKVCQLSQVSLLDLSHNKFEGAIPSCFYKMYFGAERNFKMNGATLYITSEVPFLHNWSYTSALSLNDDFEDGYLQEQTTIVDFLTKSRYEAYQGGIINYMYGLDLSSNQLSGEIPVEIGDLENIRSLNFSYNNLTGSIPYSISKLKDLESLDLSNNKLDGTIPLQLTNLNSLGYFNVSYNNLTSEIPYKGHLVTFDARSYIGNEHLCGLPTNKSCNPTRVLEPSASNQAKEEEDEGDNVIDMVWFYWTSAAVYIYTMLALFLFLCLDSRWSREWFYRVDLFVHYLQRFKGRFLYN